MKATAGKALPFLAREEVGDRPHVMVDGAPISSSVLTLSHWPGSPTPPALRHDLSAGIVFRWLRSRRRWSRAAPAVVTTDHFDQDGLVSVLVASQPELALGLEPGLMAVAEAGDFARGRDTDALRASFALSALAEIWPARSGANAGLVGDLHREALTRLPELLQRPERWRGDWEEEETFLADSARRLSSGVVSLEDVPDADLSILTGPFSGWRPASQLGRRRPALLHPVAVHNRIRRSRVLMISPPHYELYFRYETWVRLASPAWPARVDLTGAARQLSAAEPGGTSWSFNGVGATIARLAPVGSHPSDLSPEVVKALVVAGLQRTPAG